MSQNFLLRDIRNMKKNSTIVLSTTSKEIPVSVKDIKKARSSEQLSNIRGFLDVRFYITFRTKMRKSRTLTKN